ncbi:MAG TPA: M12 family metallopeptidase [Archangium sp.]|uniref:M12 family metallopeptidase n=1 Tax=Archangium sp. TaxID=1872627 RepID=UPI002E33CD01|nr:M12 family metallopeptidase [Archangium sp.]HEX5751637.1 M12 family metallopeptidase [Archangium sp.]
MTSVPFWKQLKSLSKFLLTSTLLLTATACQPEDTEQPKAASSEVRVGYVPAAHGKTVEVRYTVEDGYAVQGDMVFGRAEDIATTREEALRRMSGGVSAQAGDVSSQVMYINGGMWPGGVVYYQWDAGMPSGTRGVLQQAIDYLNSRSGETGVRLVAGTNGGKYVVLTYGSDRAEVGYKGYAQRLWFQNSLWQVGVHELGHTIGLWHEHQRCEQATYLYIYAPSDGNIAAQCDQPVVPNEPYNTQSIMHYSEGEFAGRAAFKPGVTVAPPKSLHPGLVAYDVRNLAYLYKPYDNAKFIDFQNRPTSVTRGQTFTVTAIFENTGTTAWSIAAGYKLGSQNPQDNSTWGTHRVALPGTIYTGQWAYITMNLRAPSTPGVYNFQWRMLKENVAWFGQTSTNFTIQVL